MHSQASKQAHTHSSNKTAKKKKKKKKKRKEREKGEREGGRKEEGASSTKQAESQVRGKKKPKKKKTGEEKKKSSMEILDNFEVTIASGRRSSWFVPYTTMLMEVLDHGEMTHLGSSCAGGNLPRKIVMEMKILDHLQMSPPSRQRIGWFAPGATASMQPVYHR